jgi:hypothetical protein
LIVDRYGGPTPRANWYIELTETISEYWLPNSTAQGTAIGTGMANTTAVAQALTVTVAWYRATYIYSAVQIEQFAAYACDNLQLNGYTDWFLPSIDELKQIMINREIIGGFATPALEDVGDYTSDIRATYWSSSSYGPGETLGANLHHFAKVCYYQPTTPSNTSITGINWLPNRVRPVRYF